MAALPCAAATATAATAAAAADWTGRIPALAPALRACLGADPAAHALDAEVLEEGRRVRVRVGRAGGGDGGGGGGAAMEDCFATLPSGEVLRREAAPLPPSVGPPDPAAPAFFLDRRCVDARRVEGPDGTVLGWLAYPGC